MLWCIDNWIYLETNFIVYIDHDMVPVPYASTRIKLVLFIVHFLGDELAMIASNGISYNKNYSRYYVCYYLHGSIPCIMRATVFLKGDLDKHFSVMLCTILKILSLT